MPDFGVAPRLHAAVLLVLAAAAVVSSSCGGGGVFGKVYEYEEALHLSLDGSADVIVNASIPALIALRGLDLDPDPASRFDRDRIRAAYEAPQVRVTRISRPWRRGGRRFVQVRIAVGDIRTLHDVAAFSWSEYELRDDDGVYLFRQTVGPSALRPGTLQNVGWTGQELVAFRLHLPSRIHYHNARDLETDETSAVQRGNILGWEQHLADRLDGRPVVLEVRMDGQSILYRTLWIFGGAFAAAVLVLALFIWLAMRRGAKEAAAAP